MGGTDQADHLRAMGITIYAVGITNSVNLLQLKNITGNSSHVFLAEDFDELLSQNFIKKFGEEICRDVQG